MEAYLGNWIFFLAVCDATVGKLVITTHRKPNRIYCIEDVYFDKNPKSKVTYHKENGDVTSSLVVTSFSKHKRVVGPFRPSVPSMVRSTPTSTSSSFSSFNVAFKYQLNERLHKFHSAAKTLPPKGKGSGHFILFSISTMAAIWADKV